MERRSGQPAKAIEFQGKTYDGTAYTAPDAVRLTTLVRAVDVRADRDQRMRSAVPGEAYPRGVQPVTEVFKAQPRQGGVHRAR